MTYGHFYHSALPLPFALGRLGDQWMTFMHARHMRGCRLDEVAMLRSPTEGEAQIVEETLSMCHERLIQPVPTYLRHRPHKERDESPWTGEEIHKLKQEIADLVRHVGRLEEDNACSGLHRCADLLRRGES